MKKFVNIICSQKGFIGAIGDDLPSIIPIVIALLLFFSIFSSTLTTYNNRTAEFRQRIEILSVARELKGNSLLLGTNMFEQNCNRVKIRPRPYSFVAAIYPADHDVGQIFAYENEFGNFVSINRNDFLSGSFAIGSDGYDIDPEDKDYLCQYLAIGASEFSGRETNYLIRFYPVAVQKQDPFGNMVIIPAIMAVVIW